jgi:hypothetical protein
MVSAAGKNIPVLVSPVVVIDGKLTVPAGNTKGSVGDKVAPEGIVMVSPDAPMVMVSLLSLMMLLPACVLDCIYF